jgi:L-threonine-O-3-phosphate decarboxylase
MVKRPNHGGNLNWAATLAGCQPQDLLDFSASINPLGPPESAFNAISEGLTTLTSYPDPNYRQLKSALAEFHNLNEEWILPGNGAAELLTWAAWDLAQCESVYLPTPAFGDYFRALKAFNAKIKPISGDLNCLNEEDFSQTGLLLNNPHNPTGKLFLRSDLLPYLQQFKLVVIDEAFMDFLPPETEQSLISECENYPNLVIVRSLTKFYSLPGLRLGYAIAHPDRLKQWQKLRDPWSVNSLAALVGEAVIKDQKFQQQTWQWLPPTRAKLWQDLGTIPNLKPLKSSANFLLVETRESSLKIQEKLLKNSQILIRDCLSFPELGDRYFRVAVRTLTENNRLIESLKIINISS